ncbi:hypothetical protein L1987_20951 [Smallanthus sonchifolius]|uniref:Uncharacterized protein n=1 Tax=Smallanthus sonchifolius TaxID=185202 RepID=A0ACB9ITS0_9ASTR|nr:hypothetical protein L1987_20951 [Smallanthus sonchifolius]
MNHSVKKTEYGNVTNYAGASSPAKIPVIDVSLLTSSPLELDKLKSAVTTWGCFQAVNHGIESSFLEKVCEIGELFFKLSADEKKKYLREENDVDGYGNDMVFSDDQILDWADRLYLTVLPKDQRKFQFWPQNPTHFREILDEYSSKIELIYQVTLKALARSLNLDEDCFLNQYGTTEKKSARFNYYPPCPWPEKVLGVKPHADSSAITLLLQDKEVEGLQLLKDGQWVGVPDALTINVGDQIEIMSNGMFKSPVHRVLVNSKKKRMTVAVFCPVQSNKHFDVEEIRGREREEGTRGGEEKGMVIFVGTDEKCEKGTRGEEARIKRCFQVRFQIAIQRRIRGTNQRENTTIQRNRER